MRIALGTVQFGLSYGVANSVGRVAAEEVAKILARAREAGIDTLDTAIGYGDAETVLGSVGMGGWHVITKLPALPTEIGEDKIGRWCRSAVMGSMARLGAERLDAVLLHHPADLVGSRGSGLARALHSLREEGLCTAVGVSIYGPEDLDALSSELPLANLPLDVVQAPGNVLDRRLEQSGWAARLTDRGTRIHLRSVFLQGLLLLHPDQLPPRLSHLSMQLNPWRNWLSDTGSTPLEGALRFALSRDYADRLIIGVDGLSHLEGVIQAAAQSGPLPPDLHAQATVALLDPRRWPQA